MQSIPQKANSIFKLNWFSLFGGCLLNNRFRRNELFLTGFSALKFRIAFFSYSSRMHIWHLCNRFWIVLIKLLLKVLNDYICDLRRVRLSDLRFPLRTIVFQEHLFFFLLLCLCLFLPLNELKDRLILHDRCWRSSFAGRFSCLVLLIHTQTLWSQTLSGCNNWITTLKSINSRYRLRLNNFPCYSFILWRGFLFI